jgi:hypothetical protein
MAELVAVARSLGVRAARGVAPSLLTQALH